jgi:hypothetical protein
MSVVAKNTSDQISSYTTLTIIILLLWKCSIMNYDREWHINVTFPAVSISKSDLCTGEVFGTPALGVTVALHTVVDSGLDSPMQIQAAPNTLRQTEIKRGPSCC